MFYSQIQVKIYSHPWLVQISAKKWKISDPDGLILCGSEIGTTTSGKRTKIGNAECVRKIGKQ